MQIIDQDTGEVIDEETALTQATDLLNAIMNVRSAPEAKRYTDETAALRDAARRLGLRYEVQFAAAEAWLLAYWQLGRQLEPIVKRGGDRKSKTLDGFLMSLSDLGIDDHQSARAQRLAAIPLPDLRQRLEERRVSNEQPTLAMFLKKSRHGGNDDIDLEDHQLINQSVSNEWYTPPEYIKAARELMGDIDTDPASNDQANEWIEASTYYTIDTNGFDKPWRGRVWLNPPYGKDGGDSNQERWTARLVEQHRAGITTEAVCLVNVVPGNLWFAPLWNYPICFVSRRIRFFDPDGELGSPTHSNVLVYLPDPDRHAEQFARFVRIFSQFGPVAARLLEYEGRVFIHGIEANDGDSIPE